MPEPANSQEVCRRVLEYLDVLLKEDGNPTWTKRSNRDRLFAIFEEAYPLRVNGEEIAEFLREHWLYKKDARRLEKAKVLNEACDAWSEWLFAWKNRDERRGDQPIPDR